MPMPFDADAIIRLQMEAVRRWHVQDIDHPHDGFLGIVGRQHEYNFHLWHQEDLARNPSASDVEIAQVKRTIDRLNQARNDAIEQLDDALTRLLSEQGISCPPEAPLNSETVGSIIDRLSIMALRLYHYREQTDRRDVSPAHAVKVQQRISLCEQQHHDLTRSLQELLEDLFTARKRHKTYRQMKMYNDPSLNPSIYQQSKKDVPSAHQ